MSNNELPLDGVKIIDFSQVMLGPCATQMLADFGADVIKVERPKSGDLSRNVFGGQGEVSQNNPVFCSLNRNKRSITLNTRTDAAKNVIYELIKTADVVVNNFRPGVMTRMGFGYEKLKEINPGIIFAAGTGFGTKGPYSHKGGQDVLAQAMSGVMEQRAHDSVPRSIYPTALCDYAAGMHLVQGVLAAIIARYKSGVGQKVEVSLYNSMIAMQMQEAANLMATKGTLNWAALPLCGVFDTTDGAVVVVGAFKENPLQDICIAIKHAKDLSIKYPMLEDQVEAKEFLQGEFRSHFSKMSTTEAITNMEKRDLLCAPVKSLEEALKDEQTIVNQMIATMNHPIHGSIQVISSPITMSDSPFTIRHTPPGLGQHTDEILAELGLSLDDTQ
ncbi:CaiB/BaiF CoA-transferase family protein [Candidatus Njordibacter sp. Uisw_056]|jgi:crotonobetainyl-CoA:carnitine CoA-transferase CaiB-like acyl-CoA transferase|uniref:CaiB/BaiF CoA transferase family protein n=1 Tax=Candidatus Njordibacter sp. Uisw_056 TaxID=3230973 RepID=UPI003D42B649